MEVLRERPHPARLAAKADAVIYVGDAVEALPYVKKLRDLGVEAEAYPLDPWKAPTLYSVLGLVGYIESLERDAKKVYLVDAGPGALVEYALLLVRGAKLESLEPSRLTSPLHYRLLSALELIRSAGIDLAAEAQRHRIHAFTGGDAARSDMVLLAADMETQLGLRAAAAAKYRGQRLAEPYEQLLSSLDPRLEGAVEVLALEETHGDATVYLGCRMLLRPEACSPEAGSSAPLLARILEEKGARLARIEQVEPEEAACIAYPRYPC